MSEILIQNKFPFIQKQFELTGDGLSIKSKNLTQSNAAFLKYEDIGSKIIKSNKSGIGWLLLAIVVCIYLISILITEDRTDVFDLLLVVFCIVMYFATDRRFIYLAQNDNRSVISFFSNKPSLEEVESFIENIKSKRKDFLLHKYGQLSRLISYEQQYNSLMWLNNNDVLTKDEYEFKLEELNNLFKIPNTVLGFNVRSN